MHSNALFDLPMKDNFQGLNVSLIIYLLGSSSVLTGLIVPSILMLITSTCKFQIVHLSYVQGHIYRAANRFNRKPSTSRYYTCKAQKTNLIMCTSYTSQNMQKINAILESTMAREWTTSWVLHAFSRQHMYLTSTLIFSPSKTTQHLVCIIVY